MLYKFIALLLIMASYIPSTLLKIKSNNNSSPAEFSLYIERI